MLAGMYSALPYAVAQGTVEVPYIFVQCVFFSVITYFLYHLQVDVGELTPSDRPLCCGITQSMFVVPVRQHKSLDPMCQAHFLAHCLSLPMSIGMLISPANHMLLIPNGCFAESTSLCGLRASVRGAKLSGKSMTMRPVVAACSAAVFYLALFCALGELPRLQFRASVCA